MKERARYQTIIGILAITLVGSIFLNFNLDKDNNDLKDKLKQVVELSKQYEQEKEFQNTRGKVLQEQLTREMLQQQQEQMAKDGAVIPSSPTVPGNGATTTAPNGSVLPAPTVNPYTEPNKAVVGGNIYQGGSNKGFEDLNKGNR